MRQLVTPLMRQFLEWVSDRPRTYAEVMSAWRTTCPRHSVWEDATIEGLVEIEGGTDTVRLTPRGRAALDDDGESRPTLGVASLSRHL